MICAGVACGDAKIDLAGPVGARDLSDDGRRHGRGVPCVSEGGKAAHLRESAHLVGRLICGLVTGCPCSMLEAVHGGLRGKATYGMSLETIAMVVRCWIGIPQVL